MSREKHEQPTVAERSRRSLKGVLIAFAVIEALVLIPTVIYLMLR